MNNLPIHFFSPASPDHSFSLDWDSPFWSAATPLAIDKFYPKGNGHRPKTQVRTVWDATGIFVIFRVEDQYIRCTRTRNHDSVCNDSCVEFFVQPQTDAGYFNFEFNCGGTALASYVLDHSRENGGLKNCRYLQPEEMAQLDIRTTMPKVVAEEIKDPTTWLLACKIPFAILTPYLKLNRPRAGTEWRGNFYKCASDCSHPHWAFWAPIGDVLNFHLPNKFGRLQFIEF